MRSTIRWCLWHAVWGMGVWHWVPARYPPMSKGHRFPACKSVPFHR
jgi:hypothetical protein